MSVDVAALRPGHVLVMEGTTLPDELIEIGAILRGELAASHVAVVHHLAQGVWWAIEGRAGGVGWQQATAYLGDPRTVANTAQHLADAEISTVTTTMVRLLTTPYDWTGGILPDLAAAVGLPVSWDNDPATGVLPGHVVCSSAAAYAYDIAGVTNPGRMSGTVGVWEYVTPGDWATFITERSWAH